MAEEYQKFLDFDWQDERWQTYLKDFTEQQPSPPTNKQILKQKKKWYKRHVEEDFDDTYEPPSTGSASRPPPEPSEQSTNAVNASGERWATMGAKATICFLAYAVALSLSVAAVAQVFPAYQALVVLVGAFILEVLAKYGLKFKSEYLQKVLQDENDVCVMPMMLLTLLTPGLHTIVRMVALVPPCLTALMSISQIAKHHPRLPAKIKEFFDPLSNASARWQIMGYRADAEVALGFILIVAVFAIRAAPISALLFWNFMMMRYMMSPWTQASFRKVNGILEPFFGNIPLVNRAYAAVKRCLYSFVDPAQRKSGSSFCSIL